MDCFRYHFFEQELDFDILMKPPFVTHVKNKIRTVQI